VSKRSICGIVFALLIPVGVVISGVFGVTEPVSAETPATTTIEDHDMSSCYDGGCPLPLPDLTCEFLERNDGGTNVTCMSGLWDYWFITVLMMDSPELQSIRVWSDNSHIVTDVTADGISVFDRARFDREPRHRDGAELAGVKPACTRPVDPFVTLSCSVTNPATGEVYEFAIADHPAQLFASATTPRGFIAAWIGTDQVQHGWGYRLAA
jgi:hypothetical protein